MCAYIYMHIWKTRHRISLCHPMRATPWQSQSTNRKGSLVSEFPSCHWAQKCLRFQEK